MCDALVPSGPPGARSSHSVSAVPGQVTGRGREGSAFAVFGGEDRPRHAFDAQVHVGYYIGGRTSGTVSSVGNTDWSRPPAMAPPPAPLLGHASAAVGSTLYVFGGRTGGTTCFDQDEPQVSETETSTLLWLDLSAKEAGEWGVMPGSSDGPSPRSFHSMCSLGSRLFVFGGCGERGRLNDLWGIDTASSNPEWVRLCPGGDNGAPSGRGGSSLVAFGPTSVSGVTIPARLMLLFGFDGNQMCVKQTVALLA